MQSAVSRTVMEGFPFLRNSLLSPKDEMKAREMMDHLDQADGSMVWH